MGADGDLVHDLLTKSRWAARLPPLRNQGVVHVGSHSMGTVVYIVDPDAQERQWIEGVLSPSVDSVRSLDSADALLALLGVREGACLVVSLEPDEAAALELVRELRLAGSKIPVIAIGPAFAFRTATDIARLESTDFLARPLSAQGFRAAVARAGGAA